MENFYGVISIVETPKNYGDKLVEVLNTKLTEYNLVKESVKHSHNIHKSKTVHQIFFGCEEVFNLESVFKQKEVSGYVRDKETLALLHFGNDDQYIGIRTDELTLTFLDTGDGNQVFTTLSADIEHESELADLPKMVLLNSFENLKLGWLKRDLEQGDTLDTIFTKVNRLRVSNGVSAESRESWQDYFDSYKAIEKSLLLSYMSDSDKVLAVNALYSLVNEE